MEPGFKNKDKQSCLLCVKFLKFICINTFKHKLVFDIANGRISKRTFSAKDRGVFWKVKDPFIKEYNYGRSLRLDTELESHSKRRLSSVLASMAEIIRAISKSQLK